MSDRTGIEWTDATWNPVTGCTKVSPGCDHCYAETIAHRFAGTSAYPDGFEVTLHPERLDQPMRWRRPRRVFVNSMSDLFHDDIPDDYIARVFGVMGTCAEHTFQILTKRHGRMRSLLNSGDFQAEVAEHHAFYFRQPPSRGQFWPGTWPLANIWLGVSVENQQWANIRVPALLQTPAAIRFLSCEPLLGGIDLSIPWSCRACNGSGEGCAGEGEPLTDCSDCDGSGVGIDWVIVGGESGPGARPMHPEWVRGLRDQCVDSDVAFHFKQWGEWAPKYHLRSPKAIPSGPTVRAEHLIDTDHGVIRMNRVGKKAAGRELDGRTWEEYPSRSRGLNR